MQRKSMVDCALLVFLAAVPMGAQQPVSKGAGTSVYNPNQRAFVVVINSKAESFEGDWRKIQQLESYRRDHGGSYILFTEAEALYRLDKAEDLAEAVRLSAPVRELAAQQEKLALQQKPLAERQRALAGQMRGATNPEEMGRVGAEQGRVGREQGKVGEQQGVIGQKQGVAGRALYDFVEGKIEGCMKDKSCKLVE